MNFSRRNVIGGLCAAALWPAGCTAHKSKPRKTMALTFDDFGLWFKSRLAPLQRDAAILAVLKAHNIQAAGFVTGEFVNSSEGDTILKRWGEAGHIIANHTWSHGHAREMPFDVFMADIRRNHNVLKGYQGFQPFFRFPFLGEGGEIGKINQYRAALKAEGYKRAPVTIDTIDWNVSSRFEKYLKDNPQGDITAYRGYYVKSCVSLANHFQAEAAMLGRPDLPHQTLMHHNILNALCLDDVISAWKADGWEIIPAQPALDAPFYQSEPITPTRGRSLLSVMIYDKGLTHPKFPEAYYKSGNKTMDSLGL